MGETALNTFYTPDCTQSSDTVIPHSCPSTWKTRDFFPCEDRDFFPFLLRQIDDAHTGEWQMADKTHKENIFLNMTQAHLKESTGHRESLGQALNKG